MGSFYRYENSQNWMCRLAKQKSKQGKFVEFISPAKGYFRETYKSQNINSTSPTSQFTFHIKHIKVQGLLTSFQCLVH